MSPCELQVAQVNKRFPRVSGDEPGIDASRRSPGTFSPRERG